MTALSRTITGVSERVERWPRWLLLTLAGLALVIVLGLPTIIIPFSTDQVWFALGARTILDGDQLYSDFWDQKPPLIYLLYAAPFAIAGEHMEAVRVFDLLNVCAAMAGVFLLGKRLFSERVGVFGAALYAFAYLAWTAPSDLAETEAFMAAPLAFAFVLYVPDDDRSDAPLRAAAAGVLLSVAFAFKAPAVLFALGLPACELLLRRTGSWSMQGAAARLGIAALGFAILPVALALYMAAGGVIDDFIDIQRNYTVHYNATTTVPGVSQPRFMLDETWSFITRASFLVVPAVGALFLGFFRSREARGVVLVSLLTLLGVAAIWWQGKMFSYHWVVLLPLLALLAGYALDEVATLFSSLRSPRSVAAYGLLAASLVTLAYPTLRDTYDDYRVLVRYADGSMSRRDVEARYHFLYPQNHQVVDYVKAHGGPDDRIFVWGLWPQVYFWLDRPLVDRFLVNSGLRATWAPESWRREVMRDLTASPPRFFAVGRGDTQPWLVGTAQTSEEHLRDDFPELRLFLEENYLPVLELDLFLLYELRPAAVHAPGR